MDLCFCGGETIDDESERENGIPLCSTCSTFNDWTLNGQGERQVEQHLSSDYYKLHLQYNPLLLAIIQSHRKTPLNIFRYLRTRQLCLFATAQS